MPVEQGHGATVQMSPRSRIVPAPPPAIEMTLPAGLTLSLTRRKTNTSKTVLLTVNKDQTVLLGGTKI